MRVIHIFHELKYSGAEIMYVDAASIFQNHGCELTALATSLEEGEFAQQFQQVGYKVLHKPYPELKHVIARFNFYVKFISFLKKERYDVVHIHKSSAMWGMSLCAWLAGKTSVFTFHNVFPTGKFTYYYHCLLRWSAKKIFRCRFQTISDSVYDHELNFYHNKTTKIYNWYGSNRFFNASIEEKTIARKELEIPENAFVFISIGGCSSIKRHSEVIKAMPFVLKNISDCVYLHLGTGATECEEQELAKELNMSQNIRFCGNQKLIRKFLIASDVYLMPSRFEGLAITVLEALACNIPAILYDVPGLRDLNYTGDNCIIIPEDYNVLAEKLNYLNLNPKEGIEMAARAKKFVDANFFMENNAKLIYELYR